jgi:hypothetical protein
MNDIPVAPDINTEENIITATKRKMESTAKNKGKKDKKHYTSECRRSTANAA